MDKHLVAFLVGLHGDLRVCQDRIQHFITEHHMALDPQVEAKLGEVADAITQEINEIKGLITAGADQTELLARLDSLKTSVQGISDQVSAPPTGPEV
jgi:hypothetical protein